MKIGILTFHHTTNYGATFQAYALWKTIKSQGYDVEIIDYRPYKAALVYFRKLLPINVKNYRPNKLFLTNIFKAWKMRRFLLSKMDLSKNKFYKRDRLKELNGDYNLVVCGSDQVWCIESLRDYDPSFFLDFLSENDCRKISYAASCGFINTFGKHQEEISRLVSQFDNVYVRDRKSLDLISKECNIKAKKVLDPTFLWNFDEFNSSPAINQEYLLVYRNAYLSSAQESFIKLIAKTRNLAIVSVGNHCKVADVNLSSISPEGWINYFKAASYVITNTYHGTIFSIKFKKQFTTLIPENKVNKIKDLLAGIGLENRGFVGANSDDLNKYNLEEINYNLVEPILTEEIRKSRNLLFEALDSNNSVANISP